MGTVKVVAAEMENHLLLHVAIRNSSNLLYE
jgi:hypothetical protein